MTESNRKLATIVALDVAGYSARTEADEARTVAQIALLRPVIEGIAKSHGGRVFNTAGDGFMLEFASALSAVGAALELADECRPRVRVGVHVGEVVVQPNGDLLGHGVNVAARLMAKAEPGSTLISSDVARMIRGPLAERFVSRGPVQLDKMAETIEIFAPASGAVAHPAPPPNHTAKPTAMLPLSLDRRMLMIGGGTAAAGVAGFALWQLARTPATTSGAVPSLAVLPFANLTGKPDDAAFTAGLHDDLLNRLAQISALRVVARTSVMGYANTTKKISEIAGELGVNAVLEGTVQRSGDQVRIAVQLVDGATDSPKWSESYDRALTAANLFGIQRDITESIARALNTVLAARELDTAFEGGTRNLKAFELYTRGRLLIRTADSSMLNQRHEGIAVMDQVIALDPNFAAAYAVKAYATMQNYWIGQQTEPAVRDAANELLLRAEALAPNAVETLLSRAAYHYWGFLDYEKALGLVDRALAVAPNSDAAWYLKGIVCRRAGRFAEAAQAFERSIALDPRNAQRLADFALHQGYVGEFGQAAALAERAVAINATSYVAGNVNAHLRLLKGDLAGAWAASQRMRNFAPYNRVDFAILTRDPANIKFAMDDWPEDLRQDENAPELYNIYRAIALNALGQAKEARTLLLEIKSRLDKLENPYPLGWRASTPVTPNVVPGLLADLAGVRAAEQDYLTRAPRDEFEKTNQFQSLAASFLQAGDRDRAIYYLQERTKLFGPGSFPFIAIDPAFDPLRNDPRYQTLKANYKTWAATRPDAPPVK